MDQGYAVLLYEGLERAYLMVVNDEGRLRNMDINPVASYLYGTQDHGEPIVGPAMILKQIMTDDGPDIGFLTHDEALHLVIRLGKAHQWCAQWCFVTDYDDVKAYDTYED